MMRESRDMAVVSLCRFPQRAAAARALAGGAAVAMPRDVDRAIVELSRQQARQMANRQIKHLVEVTVVDKTPPIDRNQVAAHDLIQIADDMRALQQAEIAVELALHRQHCAETLDRHVGEREQVIENNAVSLSEHTLIVGFEHL